MKKLILSKTSTDTNPLIQACHENKNSIIVCATQSEAKNIYLQATKNKITIPMPITFQQYIKQGLKGKKYTGVYFNNIEACLQTIDITPINSIVVDTNNTEIENW